MPDNLLEISDLTVSYRVGSNAFRRGSARTVDVVRNVSLSIGRNEIHGLVGGSGSGKTTVARTVIGLTRAASGSIRFKDREILSARGDASNQPKIQMVFQDPNNSLDPRMQVREILAEPIKIAKTVARREITDFSISLLESMQLRPEIMDRRPHELSGGQRQRVGLARALATNPDLIIADESTSALDVTVQAHVLNLMMDLRKTSGVSFLFISHNLGVIRHVSDFVSVMKDGQIVEASKPAQLFASPQDPYTRTLLESIPSFK